jgi:predicted transcriptional regulator
MSTTTIRLPEALKARVARVAAHSNQTAHSFILEAIAEKAEQAERRERFMQDAQIAAKEVDANGEVFAAGEVHEYLRSRLAGQTVRKPEAIKR